MAVFDDGFERRLINVNGEFMAEVLIQSQARGQKWNENESCPDTPKRENMVQAENIKWNELKNLSRERGGSSGGGWKFPWEVLLANSFAFFMKTTCQ